MSLFLFNEMHQTLLCNVHKVYFTYIFKALLFLDSFFFLIVTEVVKHKLRANLAYFKKR